MKSLLVILMAVLFIQCQPKAGKLTAQDIVDKAIEATCSGQCETAEISFTFRDKSYTSKRNQGQYTLNRTVKDSLGAIIDRLSNKGLQRTVNGALVKVADSLVSGISEGVNSVHYFAQLPYGLNAPAVNKELLGEVILKKKPYYKIRVTFKEAGGGTDFDDVFVYWIHKETYTTDYLAYSYKVNGGGIRFREAYNIRTVGGIRFADYNNYKPSSLAIALTSLDTIFEAGDLKLVSKIELENLAVK